MLKTCRALHPGDRPSRQGRPAPAAAARLMPGLPVRPATCVSACPEPVLPAWLVPLFFRDDRGAGGKSLARWWRRGDPRRLPQLSLKLRDPLPRPLQLRPRQFTAQRHHQRREHLGRGRPLISGHTAALRLKLA